MIFLLDEKKVSMSSRSDSQVKKDIERTIQFIKAGKPGKIIPLSKKTLRRLSKILLSTPKKDNAIW